MAFSASGFEGHGVTWHYPDVPIHDWGYAYGRASAHRSPSAALQRLAGKTLPSKGLVMQLRLLEIETRHGRP